MTAIPGLFVTGTDTGVGKTRIAASIVRALKAYGHRPGAMKPIASSGFLAESGLLTCADAEELADAVGGDVSRHLVCPIVLPGEVAPSVATGPTRTLANVVDTTRATLAYWVERADVMVIEGVGGLLCPITSDVTLADLAITLDFPLVIVARRGLGTLNHTLLTVEAARSRGLRIAGVVLNGCDPTTNSRAEETNPRELAARLNGIPILADLPYESGSPSRSITALGVDWWGLAKPSRMAPSPPA